MVSRFAHYRQEAVRTAVKSLEGSLLDAAIAEQKRRRNRCIRTIVQLKAALRQRLSLECWRRLLTCHRVKCDDLRTEIRRRLENKFSRLRQSAPRSRFIDRSSIPPTRCVIIDGERVDEDVVNLLNLGPSFAPQPTFCDQARMDISAALHRFAYSYSWKQNIGATVPTLQETLGMSMPFPRNQMRVPSYNPFLASRLRELISNVHEVFDKHRTQRTNDNMTQSERRGLRKALHLKSSLRFSIGDKCGGFVVMSQERDIALCQTVLLDTTTYHKTTTTHYKQECAKLQELMKRILTSKLEPQNLTRLLPKHPCVPTYYQLVKTHKMRDFEDSGDNRMIKTRPIVSSCGGPTDGLCWLLQHMLTPLLNHVSAHLRNVDQFLSDLRETQIPDCSRISYQSFDVCSLYTNVDTSIAIEACIELLRKHRYDCQLYGLSIADIEELLVAAVNFNILQFRNQLYKQTRGLAMGSRIAPLLAVIFMNRLEIRSVTSGILVYARYIDDIFVVGRNRTVLRRTLTRLNSAQPSITLTVEDPDSDGFLPFLNTKVKLSGGQVFSMWHKKAASKNILIHSRSCHPYFMKVNVVKNTLATARKVTSTNATDVISKVTQIFRENGYGHAPEERMQSWRLYREPGGVPLRIPFLSEGFARDVNRLVKRSRLPICLTFKPPPTLKHLLTASRPYERRCGRDNCNYCNQEQKICLLKGTVYELQCSSCSEEYIGESGRPLYKRLDEHTRALRNPAKYPENPFSKHRTDRHTREAAPTLHVTILHRNVCDTVERKIKEALEIHRRKPSINNKEELRIAMELITLEEIRSDT